MYIAIDPGKRTGLAKFKDSGEDITRVTLSEEHARNVLQLMMRAQVLAEHRLVSEYEPVRAFIVEDFRLRGDKAFQMVGQEMHADRMIGAVELCAHALGVPVVFQPPSILKTALNWAGIKAPRGHLPDEISAYAHGIHYLISNGIRRHRILDEE